MELHIEFTPTLGAGFIEKVYEKTMVIELCKSGLKVERQKPIKAYYEGELIGDYFADLYVNDQVIVELKAVEELCKAHEQQLVNYLVATNIDIGLLINFGSSVIVKRKYREFKKSC